MVVGNSQASCLACSDRNSQKGKGPNKSQLCHLGKVIRWLSFLFPHPEPGEWFRGLICELNKRMILKLPEHSNYAHFFFFVWHHPPTTASPQRLCLWGFLVLPSLPYISHTRWLLRTWADKWPAHSSGSLKITAIQTPVRSSLMLTQIHSLVSELTLFSQGPQMAPELTRTLQLLFPAFAFTSHGHFCQPRCWGLR